MRVVSVSELFHARGIKLSEAEARGLIEAALDAAPSALPAVTPLTAAEAVVYDGAGMGADPAALQRLAKDAAGDYVTLLATALPVAEAARRIGISRSRMQQLITARRVWAVRQGSRWMLPAVQFAGDALLPGWDEVARALPVDAHPLEVAGFLAAPQPELEWDGRPCTVPEWLLSGGAPEVAARLARGLVTTAA